jgi:hypothetical protein
LQHLDLGFSPAKVCCVLKRQILGAMRTDR